MNALSLLIKPASGNCNMRCEYCFYRDVTAVREEANRGMMDEKTLETLVQKAFDETTGFISFGFQGGEPMLVGLPFYEKLMELEQKYNTRGIPLQNSIQTNGTLITPAWAEFFANNDFLVGLSIDGARPVHDALRRTANGKTTHTLCKKAADTLSDAGADFNVLSVVTGTFARQPEEMYRFYKRNNYRFIQLIPCLDGFAETEASGADWALTAEEYGRFLCRFFDLWHADFIKGDYYSVRMFDNWVRMLMGEEAENCGMTGRCKAYPVVEADGNVYPCDFYVLDDYILGNVHTDSFTEMLSSPEARSFETLPPRPPKACHRCEYLSICRGGCRRDCEATPGETGENRLCAGYKLFFAYALPRMQAIAQNIQQNS